MLTDLVIVGWPLALANRKPSKMHSNPQKTEWNSLQPATTLRLTESVWKKKKKLGKLVNVQCGHAELIFGYFHPFGRKTEKVFGTAEEKKRNSTFPLIGTFFSVVSFHSLSLSLSLFFHLIFPPPAVGPPLCVRWPFFFFLDCHFYRRFQQQKNTLLLFSCVCVCVSVCVCVCVCPASAIILVLGFFGALVSFSIFFLFFWHFIFRPLKTPREQRPGAHLVATCRWPATIKKTRDKNQTGEKKEANPKEKTRWTIRWVQPDRWPVESPRKPGRKKKTFRNTKFRSNLNNVNSIQLLKSSK